MKLESPQLAIVCPLDISPSTTHSGSHEVGFHVSAQNSLTDVKRQVGPLCKYTAGLLYVKYVRRPSEDTVLLRSDLLLRKGPDLCSWSGEGEKLA